MEEPITPSHLIIGRRILNLPNNLDGGCDLDDDDFTLNTNQVSSGVKHLNQVLNHFWKRWRTEYLEKFILALQRDSQVTTVLGSRLERW